MKFRTIHPQDKPLILNWFQKSHVREFYYGKGLENTLKNLELYCQGINHNGRYSFEHWIGFIDDEPFAFLMTTPVTRPYDPNSAYDKWYIDGKNTFTLDILIGPEKFLGKGLASRMIQEFIKTQFAEADFFLIDPAQNNPKAIHVYEKAGFIKVGEFFPAFDPKVLHVMMRAMLKNT